MRRSLLIERYFWPSLIFSVIFSVGLAWVLFVSPRMNLPLAVDFIDRYNPIAKNLLSSREFAIIPGVSTARVPPLYPFLVSLIYAIFGQVPNVVKLTSVVFNAFTCVVIYFIGRKLFDKKIGIISAFAVGFYPLFVYQTGIEATECMFTFLFALSILYLLKTFSALSIKYAFVAGICLGAAALCRTVILIFPLFILLGLFFVFLKKPSLIIGKFAILLLGMCLLIGPWTIRNYLIFHRFIPIQTTGGINLFLGTSKKILMAKGAEERRIFIIEERRKFKLDNIKEEDKICYKVSFKRIASRPLDYFGLMPMKFIKLWGGTMSGRWDYLILPLQLTILSISIAGFIFSRLKWRETLPFVLAISYFIVIHLILYPMARYSMPVVPFILLFAVYGIYRIYGMFFSIFWGKIFPHILK